MDLVNGTTDYRPADDSLHSVVLDLRWCAIQILVVVFKASDMGNASFGLGADDAFTCRWKEFCTDTSLEKASLYLQTEEGNSNIALTSLADTLLDWSEVTTGKEYNIGCNIRYEHFI